MISASAQLDSTSVQSMFCTYRKNSTASLKNSTDVSAGSARFSNYVHVRFIFACCHVGLFCTFSYWNILAKRYGQVWAKKNGMCAGETRRALRVCLLCLETKQILEIFKNWRLCNLSFSEIMANAESGSLGISFVPVISGGKVMLLITMKEHLFFLFRKVAISAGFPPSF